MDYLKELISIVDKNKTKHIEIIGTDKFKERKLYQLYDGILSGEFESDLQACKNIYGTKQLEKGYRNLKSRLEKKAINTLFFIDFDSNIFSESQKAYYSCYKNLTAVKLLLAREARKTAVKLAEKTLKKVLHFEFYDIAIPLLKDLRLYYGSLIGDQKKLIKYNSILKKVLEDLVYEEQAVEMYIFLTSQFIKSKTISPSHIKMAIEYSNKLETYLDKTQYWRFHFYAHLIIIYRYKIENNHLKAIEASDRALIHLNQFPHTSNTIIFTFVFNKLTSNIQLQQYANAENNALTCMELVQNGSNNWFLTSQFYLLLLFHSKRYQAAYDLYNQVTTIKKKKKAKSEFGRDFWNLIEAFIHYFIRIEKIKLPQGKRRPRFDYDDFMKKGKSSVFVKDKRGMNVTILILQVLFLLNEKEENKVIDRMEPLISYTSKYLRQNENFRSNCFIKMLSKISDANFNRIALERRTKDLYGKLKSTPLEVASQPIETEIVPFEVLWEMVLDALGNSTSKSKR